ncbi:MAG: HEPN domain-containing protein [Methanosarcinaceae archaeon]|nr:HEPN domain-containing protein [Methanosarcinaceae archaeon]
MSNLEEGMRWFKQSERDLGAAASLRDSEYYESACFHAQQASEKALKGLLYAKGYRSVITHSTRELYKHVKKLIPDFKDYDHASMNLDKHYIPPRYPDAFPSGSPYEYYTKEDADKCINYAGLILAEVRNFMSE